MSKQISSFIELKPGKKVFVQAKVDMQLYTEVKKVLKKYDISWAKFITASAKAFLKETYSIENNKKAHKKTLLQKRTLA